ncbi:winged helix DNA-binding protein [Sphingosinicella humi]|nr:winged helix DNA-binding protein [Sphingosinicella humi]
MPPNIAHDALEMIEYRDMPALLVLADSDAAGERARRSAERAGCRVAAVTPVDQALERLERQAALDAVFLDVERDHGATLDRLLERLEAAARAERFGSVISAPVELIDPIATRASHAAVHHLCDPSEPERVAAIAAATAPRPPRLHDVRRAQGLGLQRLSEEVGRIADRLASLSEQAAAAEMLVRSTTAEGEEEITVDRIRAIIRARRLRDQYFHSDLFADPAWDMLLDLFAARLAQERVAVSSLCIAAAVPPTTALRWIKGLCEHGLFERSADPEDGRRVFIGLSDEAAAAMEAYLKAALRISPLPV